MKKVILSIIVSLILTSIIGCKLEKETVKLEKTTSKVGVGFNVFADKNRTGIQATFEKSSELDSIQLEFNGEKLTKSEEKDGRIDYTASFENYEKVSQFLITRPDGKQYKFEVIVEPIDFQVEEPFTIHRLKPTEIPISRPYTGQYPLSLAVFDNYIGGFKTEAQINKNKNAIILSKSDRERLSVGDAKISLYNVEIMDIENDLFDGTMHVSYKSEIKLKVVK